MKKIYKLEDLDCANCAAKMERAVQKVLQDGYRTADIWSEGCRKVGCKQMGDLLAEQID